MTDDSQPEPAPGASAERLVALEREFWNLQEAGIDRLYARPHDWRFVPTIARTIAGPRNRYVLKVLRDHKEEVRTVLDIGCGNGWAGLALARSGIKSIGVDVADSKIERARKQAKDEGLDHLARFEAMDVMALELDEPVDVLFSAGSLHHFPDLENQLPHLVERFLRPGGLMIFIEPHNEAGPSPRLSRFIFWFPVRWPLKRHFDHDLYAMTQRPEEGSKFNIRDESPAGLEFFEDHVEIDELVERNYQVSEHRYFLHFSGHLSNAFFVYMKAKFLRRLWRLFLPLLARLDTLALRFKRHQKWAEELVIIARNEPAGSKAKN